MYMYIYIFIHLYSHIIYVIFCIYSTGFPWHGITSVTIARRSASMAAGAAPLADCQLQQWRRCRSSIGDRSHDQLMAIATPNKDVENYHF
jgi:hypothetical protein